MKSSYVYILSSLIGYLAAHSIKYFLQPKNKRSWKRWVQSGGFPSGHTAVTIALTTAVFMQEGASALFAVSAIYTAIIIHDAMSVRRSVGEQGRALEKVIKKITPNEKLPMIAIGHTGVEVLAGAIVGIASGMLVAFFITL